MINKFECTVDRHKKVIEITPAGRLDSGQVAVFEKILLNRINKGDEHVVINFSKLIFVSSSGLRILLLGAKHLLAKKGTFLICAPRPQIKDLLKTAGFQKLLKIRDDRDAALQEAAEAAGCAGPDKADAPAGGTDLDNESGTKDSADQRPMPKAAIQFAAGMQGSNNNRWTIGSVLWTLLRPWTWNWRRPAAPAAPAAKTKIEEKAK